MATVLITQCFQRDFVDPIGLHDPLPNLLHVGYAEATRLLGPEPAAGLLAQLVDGLTALARTRSTSSTSVTGMTPTTPPITTTRSDSALTHCIKGSNGRVSC
jgi:hypothetical protein